EATRAVPRPSIGLRAPRPGTRGVLQRLSRPGQRPALDERHRPLGSDRDHTDPLVPAGTARGPLDLGSRGHAPAARLRAREAAPPGLGGGARGPAANPGRTRARIAVGGHLSPRPGAGYGTSSTRAPCWLQPSASATTCTTWSAPAMRRSARASAVALLESPP